MRFLKVGFRNFMSFGPAEQVLSLAKRGITLIEGDNQDDPTMRSNGSGKSTIPEAFRWGLFGKTMRGLEGDEVVNERTGKNCLVFTEWEDDFGKLCRVERYRLDKSEKNKLRLFWGNKELTHNDSDVTQEKICELLGLSLDTFDSAVVFGQGVSRYFAAMTDKEQKAVMDKLIGVEALAQAHRAAKDKLNEITAEIAGIEAGGAKADLEQAQEDLSEAQEESNGWTAKQNARLDKLRAAAKAGKGVNVADAERVLKDAEANQQSAQKAYEEASTAHTKADAAVDGYADELDKINKRLDKVMKGQGVCDRCGSEVTDAHLSRHRAEIAGERAEVMAKYNRAQELLGEAQIAKTQAAALRDKTANNARMARQALEVAKETARQREQAKAQLVEAEREENPHAKRCEKLREKVKEHEGAAKAEGQQKEALEQEARYVRWAMNAFSDKGGDGIPPIKACLLDNVVPFLNEKAAYYSEFLTEGSVAIQFCTQTTLKGGQVRDLFHVEASNRFGSALYKGNSGGEKRKVDVCTALALQALGASRARAQVNLSFWDEVFENLDDVASDYAVRLLLEERKARESIFVITHQADLKAHFKRRIKVVKHKGFSTLEER